MDPDSPPALANDAGRSSQVVAGLLLVLLGTLFFIDRQGWVWGWDLSFSRLWPVLIIALGLSRLIVPVSTAEGRETTPAGPASGSPVNPAMPDGTTLGRPRHRLGGGLCLVMVGTILLLDTNRILRLDQSWPLFIVAAGVMVLSGVGRSTRRRRRR